MAKKDTSKLPIITTNLVVDTSKFDFTKLSEHFHLAKYKIADNFKFSVDPNKFAKLHNEYKQAIDLPYYFHYYGLNLYMLIPKNEETKDYNFTCWEKIMSPEFINFNEVETHIILKVLLSLYFYEKSETGAKVCQPHFFMFGQYKGKTNNLCLSVKMSIATAPKRKEDSNSVIQEFNILPETRWLIKNPKEKVDKKFINSNIYYELDTKHSLIGKFFRQVKKQFVTDWLINPNDNTELYSEPANARIRAAFRLGKAEIPWNIDIQDKNEYSRGYLTYIFQSKFSSFCNDWLGDNVVSKKRYYIAAPVAEKLKSDEGEGISEAGLRIKALDTVYCFDNRLKNEETQKTYNSVNFQEIIESLSKRYSSKLKISFKSITDEELEKSDFCEPVLTIQDVDKNCFVIEYGSEKKEGFLKEALPFVEDPKQVFYQKYPHLPKQSFSINLNKIAQYNKDNFEEYFDYNQFSLDFDNYEENTVQYKNAQTFNHKLEVCLNELFLKTYIVKKWNVKESIDKHLPLCFTKNYMYDFAYMYDKVLVYIDKENSNSLDFVDLEFLKGKEQREKILNKFNLKWQDIEEQYINKYKKINEEEGIEHQISKQMFIFSNRVCVELEEPNERILMNYDEGSKRSTKNKKGTEGIWYCKINRAYTVGLSENMNMILSKANKMRKFDVYFGVKEFKPEQLLETCAVGFVRNKQFTVYPYFFDLIRLYKEHRNN